MTEEHLTFSDDEEDSDNTFHPPELQGTLSKWTNYIHGWQDRFIVLKDGTLSYYKSEQETGFGCRGAISLFKASIKPHEFDECRFDVSVNDCVWYLRAETPEDRQHWIDILEAFKAESGYGSENSLKRHGSAISLSSVTLSSTSTSSCKKGRGLKEKLAEMETFRDILCGQMETLQKYFDSCAEDSATVKDVTKEHGLRAVDFKGEAMTFRATAGAVLATLQHCLEAVGQREELWRRRLQREAENRHKLEAAMRHNPRVLMHGGPDHEEGPHSTLHDDEFYDAVDAGLEKLDADAELLAELRLEQPLLTGPAPSKATNHPLWSEKYHLPEEVTEKSTRVQELTKILFICCENIDRHVDTRLPDEFLPLIFWLINVVFVIERVTQEQIHYAGLGVGEGGWELFAEEGEMKMYRREEEVNGLVMDPLKACHVVKGVTGHEMCHYFFSPQYRHEWEATLEQMKVLEKISDDTLIFHQVHKRIWPTSQRDALFWSHVTQVPNQKDQDSHTIWVVVNNSTQLPVHTTKSNKCVRVTLTVCLLCQTLITPPKDGAQITRDDITCKVTYCSVVNPGGWVPASALRAVYKREYPKFLKRFTSYVRTQTHDKSILF